MTAIHLNWFDYCLLFIIFLSLIWGLYRGFLREIISLITWIAAFLLAIFFSSHLTPFFHQYIKTEFLSGIISFLLLFIGTLIIGALINHIVGYLVKGSGLSIPNHILGGVFGLARGVLIILFITFFITNTNLQEHAWLQNSQITYELQSITSWMQGKILDLSKKIEKN